MFRKQPKIDIKPSKKDKKLIVIGWLFISINFVLVLLFYFDLPETIPTHFNFKGEPDGYGNKSYIWSLPILNLVLYFGLNLVATKLKPWQYNYPVTVTNENASKLYSMGIQLIIWLNLAIAILITFISLHTLLLAKGIIVPNLKWVTPVLTAVITITPFLYIYKMFKVPK